MKLFLFFTITFSASLIRDPSVHAYFVVWNVGQGQWTTALTPQECYHFDAGGEFFPWKKILSQCRDKKNLFFLSHWDWDHIGGLSRLRPHLKLPDLCIALAPVGTSTKLKRELLSHFPPCSTVPWGKDFRLWTPIRGTDSNSKSHVILFHEILIPGDSPIAQEKRWSQLSWVTQGRILILGHHGSKTSTSEQLLSSLPFLKLSIGSARWARYQHPHSFVELRLRKAKVPLLRTEDWGNIWLEQPRNWMTFAK